MGRTVSGDAARLLGESGLDLAWTVVVVSTVRVGAGTVARTVRATAGAGESVVGESS